MKQRIFNKLPILVMMLGTVSLFLMSIFFKKYLHEDEYGKFSILLTYTTLLNSFGLLGVEQLILRKGNININKNNVIISPSIKNLTFIAFFVASIIIPLIFNYLNIFKSLFELIAFSFFIVTIMLCFNVFRLLKSLSKAQIIQASWKILVLLICMILIAWNVYLDYYLIACIFLLGTSVTGIIALISLYRRISLFNQPQKKLEIEKEDLKLILYFLISLLTVSVIGTGDKFLIERNYNLSTLGTYFFLYTIITFPFNFVQSYLGFIYIVDYRESSNPVKTTKQKLKSVITYSALLSLTVLFAVFIIVKIGLIDVQYVLENWILIFVFLITGIIRLLYSIYSSWMGAIGTINSIKKANYWSLALTLLSLAGLIIFPSSLLMVAVGFLFMWLTRLLIWKYFCTYEHSL